MDSTVKKEFDVEGHRGCRGLYPENTIPAFLNALDLGVTTLEMDFSISSDHKVIVSHEPFFNQEITTPPLGLEINADNHHEYNLYQMTYDSIKSYDVGSKFYERFPTQKKMVVHKPSFDDVVIAVKDHVKSNSLYEPHYNVEIKRKPEYDNIYHPDAETFATLVLNTIKQNELDSMTIIQSFDLESLQIVHKKNPQIRTALLIENQISPVENIQKLGFTPTIYSPYYKLVDKELVEYCKKLNMDLIPWTVNEKAEMIEMINIGVDGLISDYPDRLIEVVDSLKISIFR